MGIFNLYFFFFFEKAPQIVYASGPVKPSSALAVPHSQGAVPFHTCHGQLALQSPEAHNSSCSVF